MNQTISKKRFRKWTEVAAKLTAKFAMVSVVLFIGFAACHAVSRLATPPSVVDAAPEIINPLHLISTEGTWRFADSTISIDVETLAPVSSVKPANEDREHEHLLPLDDANRVCGRWSNQDQLLLEMVSLDAERYEILDRWRQAGWQIRHSGFGGRDSFSFLCAKSGTVVYAWSQQSDQIKSLLLSSTPDVTLRTPSETTGENI